MSEWADLEASLQGDVLTDPADCLAYGFDNSRREQNPAAVVIANHAHDVQAAVRWCARHQRPLTVRGRGTNTVGASVPLAHGLVLSMERMDRVIDYQPADRYIEVEAGILNQAVQDHVAPDGLFWAPDPTSAPYSSVGGNLGCNAGGPKAVRYGTCRDNVLGLSAVIGNGELIRVGARTTKAVVGLDLTRLLVGSEGTLGIIISAVLRLTPRPAARRVARIEFASVAAAAQGVATLLSQPVGPSVCEFLDDRAVGLIRDDVALDGNTQAILLVECHADHAQLHSITQAWKQALGSSFCAWEDSDDPSEMLALWAARKALSPRLRRLAPNKTNEDVVVPVSKIPQLVATVAGLSERHGIPIVCFGHAGNGNLHVNLMYDKNNRAQLAEHDQCLEGVFRAALGCGGSLSGEHGVGLAKRDFVHWELDPATLAAMRSVKHALDPHGILNPDKGLPPVAPD